MIFDAHGDILTDIHEGKKTAMNMVFKNKHLENFQRGKIKGAIFILWLDPYQIKGLGGELFSSLANISNEILENKDAIKIVKKAKDLDLRKEPSKTQVILGIEGLKVIEGDINLLDFLYIYGLRHISLTWNEENALATGIDGNENRGLTRQGERFLKRAEELKMIIDLSHLNEKSFWEAMEHTKGIVIASHSNSREICDHKRNLSDSQIKAIASRNGVVGMNIHRHFVDKRPEFQNIERLVDHIDHLRELVGVEHIGFGFDFCEYLKDSEDSNIGDLENASQAQKIVLSLKNRGYTDVEIEKISYQNFQRTIKEILL